jgi:hypothetical protein
MAIDKITTPAVTDANITSGKIADDAITLAKMAPGTDGNIISYDASGNPVAVATGSAGQVLTSAGAGAPPTFSAAPGGGWVKISTVTASSSSSVDFDNIASTYKAYAIIGTQIKPANNTVEIQMNFGSDGTNYAATKTSVYYMQYNRTSGDDSTGTIDAGNSLENATGNQVLAYGLSDNAAFAKSNTMFAYFGGLAQGGYSSYNVEFNMYGSNSYNYGTKVTGAVIGDVDCVRFVMSSGNIASGTFTLYGIDQS